MKFYTLTSIIQHGVAVAPYFYADLKQKAHSYTMKMLQLVFMWYAMLSTINKISLLKTRLSGNESKKYKREIEELKREESFWWLIIIIIITVYKHILFSIHHFHSHFVRDNEGKKKWYNDNAMHVLSVLLSNT